MLFGLGPFSRIVCPVSRWAKALPAERRIRVLTSPNKQIMVATLRGPSAITIAATDAGRKGWAGCEPEMEKEQPLAMSD